jgi:hypothetical protein
MRSSAEIERNSMEMELEEMMPEYKLERMYPKTYDIIYPEVMRQSDMYDKEHGNMTIPSRDEIERMVDNVVIKIEIEIENSMNMNNRETDNRQLGFWGGGLLRDFTAALLLRELFGRRHRPYRRRRYYRY